jgi:hypothetical protein
MRMQWSLERGEGKISRRKYIPVANVAKWA